MSDAKPAEAPPAAKKAGGGGPMPLIGVVLTVLNLGATGFVATKVLKLGHMSAGPTAQAEPSPPPNLPSAAFEPFVVNLNEPGSNRYLKTSFEVELGNEKAVETINHEKKALRDDILRYLSGLTVAETMGEAGKDKIQEQIIARVDKAVGAGGVRHLYFTDFVIQ